MNIYIAHPISGLSYDEVVGYFTETARRLTNMGYYVLSPMTGKKELRTELEFKAQGYDNVPAATNHAIFERDRWMCTEQADVVYANLLGTTHASIGTCCELAWAADHGKHTIVVMEKNNVHQHAFILEAADVIFETHEEAMIYLAKLSGGEI